MLTRRTLLGAGLAGAALHGAGALSPRADGARVIVVGGGFGGATCARYLKRAARELDVTLIEPSNTFVTCPMSNAVLGGMRSLESIELSYGTLERDGIVRVPRAATSIDPKAHTVTLDGGDVLHCDRLVVSPGIDFAWDAIDGASADSVERMPHAWKAGEQTRLLQSQLAAMRKGGVFVISIPDNPYRCPPGPYERACLVAAYLKEHNPTAKIVLLDAKDTFTKQPLFEEAWRTLYPGMIERVARADGGTVTGVRPATLTFVTELEEVKADVANLIPPQRAGRIVRDAGLDEGRGWCEVDPTTFESRVAPGVHLVGDAINFAPMPKSAFAANNQAKACASAVIELLAGRAPPAPFLINTCYSLAAADYGFSIEGVYGVSEGKLVAVDGSTGQSPVGATRAVRALEARYTNDWYRAIVHDTFG